MKCHDIYSYSKSKEQNPTQNFVKLSYLEFKIQQPNRLFAMQ